MQTSREEAYRKLDEIATQHTEMLRKLTKEVQEARLHHDDESVKKAVNEYDEALERYSSLMDIMMIMVFVYLVRVAYHCATMKLTDISLCCHL